jgi:hypothetical protein
MHAAAENPEVAKRTGVSQQVAHEFIAADKSRKIGKLPDHVGDKKPTRTRRKAKRTGAIPGLSARQKK